MAWDTERTRRQLLVAATAEFAAHGPAGARIDRIAETAGVNKERIYSYFGNKDALFEAVIVHELSEVFEEVPLEGEGPQAIGDYAAGLFDRIVRKPEIGRLMAWEGLVRGGDVPGRTVREEHCRSKVGAVQRALPGVSKSDAGQLLLTVVTLTDGWAVFPQLAEMFTADSFGDRRDAVRRLAEREAAAAVERAAS